MVSATARAASSRGAIVGSAEWRPPVAVASFFTAPPPHLSPAPVSPPLCPGALGPSSRHRLSPVTGERPRNTDLRVAIGVPASNPHDERAARAHELDRRVPQSHSARIEGDHRAAVVAGDLGGSVPAPSPLGPSALPTVHGEVNAMPGASVTNRHLPSCASMLDPDWPMPIGRARTPRPPAGARIPRSHGRGASVEPE
jgi:hypothetical protein